MSAGKSGGRVILVVEDNPTNLMLIRALLARAGLQVETSASAEEAELWLEQHHPAVILMDIQLPGRDGLSLTRDLKSRPETATVPIIALTAHAMRADRERALAAGCDGYIAKPINTRTLVQEIKDILAGIGSDVPVQVPHA